MNPITKNLLGKKLQTYRKEKGVSQKTLGTLLGVKGSYVSHMERGVRKPKSYKLLRKISEVIGVPLDDLLK